MAIRYDPPEDWMRYDIHLILNDLLDAKAAVKALTGVPFQRSWAERLQQIQLKQEVAGTSRIEGAEFTERELEQAISGETPEDALTRSQKQARAATFTYRWIASLPVDRPLDRDLVVEVHRRIVTGCDDDHCEPGALRADGHNVTFGTPRHRGAEGGEEVNRVFGDLFSAVATNFNSHDVLLRGLALHYHLGAMHPFGDGNGRTARAIEALLLQRAGLKDALFISLSNYYYDEKETYLKMLAVTRASSHDLTSFFNFGLRGITTQCNRLLVEINMEIRRSIFRNLVHDLFNKMQSPKRRLIAKRQVAILNYLLDNGRQVPSDIEQKMRFLYSNLKVPTAAFYRDLINLLDVGAIKVTYPRERDRVYLDADLTWPERVTEGEFFKKISAMPSAKTYRWLQRGADPDTSLHEE